MIIKCISDPVTCTTSSLGVQLGNIHDISDSQITASTSNGIAYPYLGRLHSSTHWAADVADQTQWIQVALYSNTEVIGVIVQGSPDRDEWITRYNVAYTSILHKPTWEFVLDDNNTAEVRSLSM